METIINLENVSLIRDGNYILKNISWQVKKNEQWAVIGRNGAGKSFLLRILSANLFPSHGSVKVLGKEFGKVNMWYLRRQIGVVSDLLQQDYYQTISVRKVIYSGFFSSIGLYKEVSQAQKQKTEELLYYLGINNLEERIFGKCSHGEQRRILIARALVFDPHLLVLDEPCTGLDVASREEFLKTLQKLLIKDLTIIFVTHHIEEIFPAINRVLFLIRGKVFLKGQKTALMTKANLKRVLECDLNVIKRNGRYFYTHNR